MYKCVHCEAVKPTQKSLTAHTAVCSNNPNAKRVWNKGETAETNEVLANKAVAAKGKKRPNCSGERHPFYKSAWGAAVTGHSDETKSRLSVIAKNRNLGGYVQGSGRGKKGWYKGFFCDSSWELAFVVYCLEHGIQIQRNTEKRQYEWKGKIRNYTPDFIVEGRLTEIKGFKTEQWVAKINANSDVHVLYEGDMQKYIDFVTHKYGKMFTSLYETN